MSVKGPALAKAGGVMTLTEVYCLYNQTRGLAGQVKNHRKRPRNARPAAPSKLGRLLGTQPTAGPTARRAAVAARAGRRGVPAALC